MRASFYLETMMLHRDLLTLTTSVAHEKNLDPQVVQDALHQAMAWLVRRSLPEGAQVRVALVFGQWQAWRQWQVMPDDARLENVEAQVRAMDAEHLNVGDTLEEPVEIPPLGRTAARHLYQHLVQGLREGSRTRDAAQWAPRVGEMVLATVKRRAGRDWDLEADGTDLRLPAREQIREERLKPGQRLWVLVQQIVVDGRGPVVQVSRTDPALLEAVLAREVPDVQDGRVIVRAVARDPGKRAKVIVEGRGQDPIAACVGYRGARVQAVAEALNGERLDLIPWTEAFPDLVLRALVPAQPTKLLIDEQARRIDVAVPDEQVGLALGRHGQNVRLASQVLGWPVRILGETAMAQAQADEDRATAQLLMSALDADADIVAVLMDEGFADLETLAWVDAHELLVIEGLDEDMAAEIQARARAYLNRPVATGVWATLSLEEQALLASAAISDVQALAEAAATDLEGMAADRAAALVLAARTELGWLQAA